MSSNPLSEALEPDFDTVFGALTSEQCWDVLRSLDSPRTAAEIASECDLPRSTAYAKLESMVEAGLLRKQAGEDAARYVIDFEEVVVTYPNGDLELTVEQPARSASDQLSELWDEVRAETSTD
ncbi:winged helix-turn-helix domain-containing protein [Halobellus litoreus]|jgi:DNA-binding IclR family transcriptional regulator|uniref:Helix-turn-helix domain-containing protein n=1 Tax=Halobellus litoreus TaxID=755310 RepID=A0ABD6DY96_9EURY|nr:helix-turn-helix domain-containing protein [Halobellus litoreus]